MTITRILAIFLTGACSWATYAQQSKNPTPAPQTIDGIVIASDGTKYWSGFKIASGAKEYTFVTEYRAKQGTNPAVAGGRCCEIGTRVRVAYIGSITRQLLNVKEIFILGPAASPFMPNDGGVILVPAPPNSPNAPRPMKTPTPIAKAELGFAGDWSDGASWLMIIKDDDKIRAIYPSAKSPQVMTGTLQSGNQLRLTNNSIGRFFDPFENYDGDFSREAWAELGVDRNLLTVRFSQARDGRSIVMKRIPEKPTFRVPEAKSVTWASVSSGSSSSCALTTLGVPYCWRDRSGAGLVEVVGDMTIAMVSKRYVSTCWVTTSGEAYCDGVIGDVNGRTVPTAVPGGLRFSSVSVGKNHACGLTTSGEAYCWGSNFFEQLGNPTISSAFGGQGEQNSILPVAVAGGLRFTTLSAGSDHTCAVTTDGSAYCWGSGSWGQLGNGTAMRSGMAVLTANPTAVAGGLRFASVTASNESLGKSFTCGLTTTGEAYCWGAGSLGSLKTEKSSVPVAVDGGLRFTALSAGSSHVCGIAAGGDAYCWGRGAFGVLGTGTNKDALTPVPVSGGLKFASISSGWLHTCGVTTAGGLLCWGANGDGELGDGTTERRLAPSAVRMQTDEDGFRAFLREFGSAVRKRDRVAVESYMSPAIVFPVDIRSKSMAFDYLDYDGGKGWKWLEREISSGARPYKDSEPRPVARITNDKNVIFGRGPDGRWRWLRFGKASFWDK